MIFIHIVAVKYNKAKQHQSLRSLGSLAAVVVGVKWRILIPKFNDVPFILK